MEVQKISNKQGICLLIMFIIGNSLFVGLAKEARKDAWIAVGAGVILGCLMTLIYAKILFEYEGKNLFEINEIILGKFIGKIINILYLWYAIHVGALVLRYFSEFISIVGLHNTPPVIICLINIILAIFIVRSGIKTIGTWTTFFLFILLSVSLTSMSLDIPNMNLNNIRPVLNIDSGIFMKGAFDAFAFPFGETVLLMAIFPLSINKSSYFKVYTAGLLLGGLMLFAVTMVTVSIIGETEYGIKFFPPYVAATRISISDFVQRFEAILLAVSILGGFGKLSICLLAACKAAQKIFNKNDYCFIITPIGLLMVNVSVILYENFEELLNWTPVWAYYSLPFQVIIPLIILTIALIRKKCKVKYLNRV